MSVDRGLHGALHLVCNTRVGGCRERVRTEARLCALECCRVPSGDGDARAVRYEGLGDAWGEFGTWIDAEGLTVAPNLWESYVTGPESSPDPATSSSTGSPELGSRTDPLCPAAPD